MRFVVVVLAATLVPNTAFAHGFLTAAGGFHAGLLHPWLVAEQTLSLLAAGIVLGRYCGDKALQALGVIAIPLLIGLAVPPSTFTLSTISVCLLGLTLVGCTIVALNLPIPHIIALALGALAGLTEGIASAPDPDHWDVVAGFLAGSILRALMIFSFVFVLIDWLLRERGWHWASIGVRMVSAWTVAISLLMLALLFVTP